MTDRRSGRNGRPAALQRVRRRWGALRNLRGTGDDGMALPIVVSLALVSALLVTGVTAVSLGAVGSTTSSRAAVQSQSSAEAGLAAAQASIMAGSRACTFSSTEVGLAYSVQVQYGSSVPGATSCAAPTGATTAVTASTAVIVSTGTAGTSGTQGNSSGDSRRLQGVMTLSTTTATPSASPSTSTTGAPGAAVFTGAGISFQNQNTLRESSSGAADALVYARSGSVSCANNTEVQGQVRASGDITLNNPCTFSSVWSGGRVTATASATVLGDVFAASTSTGGTPAVDLGNGNPHFRGNVYANGSVALGDGDTGGSVLSTAGVISFRNGSTVGGSAYGSRGITYAGGGRGKVTFDALSNRGSLAAPTAQNANDVEVNVGGNAAAAGCIASSVRVSGTASPAPQPRLVPCAEGTSLSSGPTFPSTPRNPSSVPATMMPSTVSAPPQWTFPTLTSRTSGGADDLAAWTSSGWTVAKFTGSSSCNDALAYLKRAVTAGTAESTAWTAAPLLVVIRDCGQAFQLDADNNALLSNNTLWLRNDLAIMSDSGVRNQNSMKINSSVRGQERDLYWLVPSDSPRAAPSSCTADLSPGNIQDLADVRWMMYTPCQVNGSNQIGSRSTPLKGAVYAGGQASFQSLELQFSAIPVPGLSGDSVTSSSPSGSGSSGTSGATSSTWSLTDVRDLSRG